MRRNRLVPVVAVVGAIALFGAACSDDDDNDTSSETTTPVATNAPDEPTTTTMAAGDTIVDLAVATPDLSTLVEAVTVAGLVDTLSGEGPFTVFAPTKSVTIVASDAGVTVNGASVIQADVVALNGVVHVIDQVLLPPDVQLSGRFCHPLIGYSP